VNITSTTQPTSLSISVYSPTGALALDHAIKKQPLSGNVIVELPAKDQEIRVAVVDPGGLVGGARFLAHAHQRVSAQLALAPPGSDAAHADSDGDGVVDEIDDCPSVSNHDQADADGDGRGDACANGDLSPGPDLSSPPSLCSAGSFLLCDGFEGSTFDEANWPLSLRATQGGSIALDSQHAYRGRGSARLHFDTTPTAMTVLVALTESRAVSLPLYVRAFFLVSDDADAGTMGLETGGIDLVSVGTTDNHFFELGTRQDTFSLNYDYPPEAAGEPIGAFWQPGTWFCLELGLTNDALQIWIDGKDVTPANHALASPPTIASVSLGPQANPAPALTAFDVYLDEVAVANQPIGCTR
jgi:hypothetical protein